MPVRIFSRIAIFLGLFLSVSLGYFGGRLIKGEGYPAAQFTSPGGNGLAQGLAREGWVFTAVDPNQPQASGIPQPVVARQTAIEAANASFPGLQTSPDLTGIEANLGRLSSSSLQQAARSGVRADPTFLEPRPVWIVTYAGIREVSSGPPGSNHSYSNEVDVIIDAMSGDYLMAMVWTR